MRAWILLAVALPLCAADAHRAAWQAVAGHLITTPPDAYPFNWGEGVQFIGLLNMYERTGDARYADYAEKWAALFTQRPLDELLNIGAKAHGARPGYCGYWSPATALLLLHRARPRPEYLRLAEGVAEFVRKGAERGPDGALGHWLGSHQLWVDTLYMACPLLAATGRREDLDDAAGQILAYAKPMQDARTGLFVHMWDWQTQQKSDGPWGRGNGWVLMSLADTLEALPRAHPRHAPLKNVAARLAAGVVATEDREAMWHTVLDDPASYPEASATSMFVYGLLKLTRLGVLPAKYRKPALRAWAAVNERYVKDGVVTGVSAGTDPRGTTYYRERPTGVETWGTGAYLMAGSEVARLAK